ncbi:MAG: M23 family metallopeptidase [Elainellaceae cyanobacterium]
MLPVPQVPGRDYIPFTPVDEVMPDVSPAALPPAGTIAGIEIEVVPFEGEAQMSRPEASEPARELPVISDVVVGNVSRPTALPVVERANLSGDNLSPQAAPAEAIATELGEPAESKPQAAGRGSSGETSQAATPPSLDELLTFAEQITEINAEQAIAANGARAPQTGPDRAPSPASAAEKSGLLAASEPVTPEAIASPEHRGWFDRQLAETAARQKAQREARLRENLIDTARRHLEQNNVTAAQQIAQNPVFLDAERTALQQAIASAQPAARAPITEPKTDLARDVLRLAARQAWLLERLPAVATSSCKESQGVAVDGDGGIPPCGIDQTTSNTASSYAWLVQAANRAQPSGRLPLMAAAPITSRYGWRIHPIFGDRRFHAGVDFGAPLGTPVHASLSGYVETSDYLSGYGFTVVLEDSSGRERHLYAHLADLGVRPGQWVNQGQVIGWVGSTGNSTGPHLHFEVHRLAESGWATIDPLSVASPQNASL